MSKFYTQTGDDGYTGLLGEGRIAKYSPRMEAIGDLDETTAAFGLARAVCQLPQTSEMILAIQRDLYKLMAEVASTPENSYRFTAITAERVTWLETHIDTLSKQVTVPQEFILPGDTLSGAVFSLTRTVVRRAERSVAKLLHSGELANQYLLHYLNRLSSLCFILELQEIQAGGNSSMSLAKG